MANADMNRLMDQARIRLPGALDGAMQMELFSAMDEFFQRSNIWYEDLEFSVTPVDGSPLINPEDFTYEVVPSAGQPIRLVGVIDEDGAPVSASMETPGSILLSYSPNVAGTYKARVILSVVDPTTSEGNPQFPDWIMTKYREVFLEGLIGRMMTQIAKPYSSAAGAQYHLRNFKRGVSQARVEAQHANVYRGQSWTFPQTFMHRRNRSF